MKQEDLPLLDWRKSSFSGNTSGQCVTVAPLPDGGVAVRHSQDALCGTVLTFTAGEWDAFKAGVRAGEF